MYAVICAKVWHIKVTARANRGCLWYDLSLFLWIQLVVVHRLIPVYSRLTKKKATPLLEAWEQTHKCNADQEKCRRFNKLPIILHEHSTHNYRSKSNFWIKMQATANLVRLYQFRQSSMFLMQEIRWSFLPLLAMKGFMFYLNIWSVTASSSYNFLFSF